MSLHTGGTHNLTDRFFDLRRGEYKFDPGMSIRAQKAQILQNSPDTNYLTAAPRRALPEQPFILRKYALSPPAVSAFEREQTYEGHVLSIISKQAFVARIIDMSFQGADEEAEFNINEISQDDRYLIVPGAIFTWNIGLQDRNKQLQRVSDIRFRRLPAFTQGKIKAAESFAKSLSEKLQLLNDLADNWPCTE